MSLRRTCSAIVRSCTTRSASPPRRGSSSDSLSRACGRIRFQDHHSQYHQHQYDPCDHGDCHHGQDPDSSSSGFQRLLDERQLSFCQHTLYRLHFDKVLAAYISFRNIYQENIIMLVMSNLRNCPIDHNSEQEDQVDDDEKEDGGTSLANFMRAAPFDPQLADIVNIPGRCHQYRHLWKVCL